MSKDIVIFKKDSANIAVNSDSSLEYKLKIWKPSLLNLVPPNKNYKYVLYWVFHFLSIFRNKHYSSYLLYNSRGELISTFLVVPSYFKWPFMDSKDVQFTYVMTSEKYKGRGIAGKLIETAMVNLYQHVGAFWYVTDIENVASIKVAQKMGFNCIGTAQKTPIMSRLKLKTESDKKLKIAN